MIHEPSLSDLIESDLAGTLTPAEREALRRRIESDPKAREIHRAQREVAEALAAITPADPPRRLREAVARSIAASPAVPRPIVPFPERARRAIPYLYAAAAGAAVCFLSLQFLAGDGPSIEGAGATMGSSARIHDRVSVDGEGIRGEASVRSRRRTSEVALDLAVDSPSRMSVRFDPSAVEFVEFTQDEGGAREVEVSRGAVRWTQQGHERVTVRFSGNPPEGAAVDVAVVRDGGETALGRVRLPVAAPAETPR